MGKEDAFSGIEDTLDDTFSGIDKVLEDTFSGIDIFPSPP